MANEKCTNKVMVCMYANNDEEEKKTVVNDGGVEVRLLLCDDGKIATNNV